MEKKNKNEKPSWRIKAIVVVALFLMRLFAEMEEESFIWASRARASVERLNDDLKKVMDLPIKEWENKNKS